jgi:hypothetical protein
VNSDGAFVYLKLRSRSVPKEDAILFARRERCHVDISQKRTGPHGAKILKINSDTKN